MRGIISSSAQITTVPDGSRVVSSTITRALLGDSVNVTRSSANTMDIEICIKSAMRCISPQPKNVLFSFPVLSCFLFLESRAWIIERSCCVFLSPPPSDENRKFCPYFFCNSKFKLCDLPGRLTTEICNNLFVSSSQSVLFSPSVSGALLRFYQAALSPGDFLRSLYSSSITGSFARDKTG